MPLSIRPGLLPARPYTGRAVAGMMASQDSSICAPLVALCIKRSARGKDRRTRFESIPLGMHVEINWFNIRASRHWFEMVGHCPPFRFITARGILKGVST